MAKKDRPAQRLPNGRGAIAVKARVNPATARSLALLSRTIAGRKWKQSTLVVLTAVLLLLMVGVWLSMKRDVLEKSDLVRIWSYLERNKPADSAAIFLGSSRFISCIKTDIFAELSGVKPSRVLNLASDSAGPWEQLLIFRKCPYLLESSPLLIVELEPWMFNKNLIHPLSKTPVPFNPHFYTWATLEERLEFPDPKTRVELVIDYFWPYSQRRTIDDWVSLMDPMTNGRKAEAELGQPRYHSLRAAHDWLANNPDYEAHRIAQCHLNEFEFDELKATYFKRLLNLVEKKSKRIVFVLPPARKEYVDEIYKNPKYLAAYKEILAFIHGLENEKVHSIIWGKAEDCQLDDSIFVDYGHFNLQGARVFTKVLFKKINELGMIAENDRAKEGRILGGS